MPIHVEIYDDVSVSIDEIVDGINEKEAFKLIKLVIKKFPNVISLLINEGKEKYAKLFPEPFKSELIKKYQSDYKSLNEFTKSKSKS